MIICNIIVIPRRKQRFQHNLSEEDKDMLVNEISLVIQKLGHETSGTSM